MDIIHEKIVYDYTMAKKDYLVDECVHWHQRMEICQVLEGSCQFNVSNKIYNGNKGDILIIRSGEIHRFSPQFGKCTLYVCTFNAKLLYSMNTGIKFIQTHIPYSELESNNIADEVSRIINDLSAENDSQKLYYELFMQTDIIRLWGLLLRYFEKEEILSKKDLTKFQNFQTALEYISDNYMNDITLTDIAGLISYSQEYVSTMFITYSGVNFKKYIDNLRIDKAIDLLKTTNLTISNIAINCGFDNIRTFNNTFKRMTGSSPTQLIINKI